MGTVVIKGGGGDENSVAEEKGEINAGFEKIINSTKKKPIEN